MYKTTGAIDYYIGTITPVPRKASLMSRSFAFQWLKATSSIGKGRSNYKGRELEEWRYHVALKVWCQLAADFH
jgi:hypothetical protein